MKLNGVTLTSAVFDYVPILRDTFSLMVKVQNIQNPDEFDTLCHPPKATTVERVGEEPKLRPPSREAMADYHRKYTAFLVIRSITEILKVEGKEITLIEFAWEKVDLNDADTFERYLEDLTDAGFTDA